MIQAYFRPSTIEEALDLQSQNPSCVFLSGGTVVLGQERSDCGGCIDLQALSLKEISLREDQLEIGAMVTLQEIMNHELFSQDSVFNPLRVACGEVKNRNIRNMATIGGNIAAKKSSSNILPVLMLMDTVVVIQNSREVLEVSLNDYLNESIYGVITNIIIPKPNKKSCFIIENYQRTLSDISIISLAFRADEECWRTAIGGVGSVTREFTLDSFNNREELKELELNPVSDHRGSAEFKKEIAHALLWMAVEKYLTRGEKH